MECKSELPEVFSFPPAVYAVGGDYQIMVPVNFPVLMWVKVGDSCFYDDVNGILRSAVTTHRMTLPMEVLDRAGEYTICWRKVEDRLAYFSKTGEVCQKSFAFRPVRPDAEVVRAYHLADAHNMVEQPVAAAGFFGDKLDILILNGDIPNSAATEEAFAVIHRIAGMVTGGNIPVVFSRGNHDLRGVCAEKFGDHTPQDNGKSYFTFRLGPMWGVVLDCAEDKADSHPEYGNTVCCHDFRLRETEFLRKLIKHADTEYAAPGVKFRLVVSHIPFTWPREAGSPFDIEHEVYSEWCRLLGENIHPQLILAGHSHRIFTTRPGDANDKFGEPCPMAVASLPKFDPPEFTGAALEFSPQGITLTYTDQDLRVVGQDKFPLNTP